MPPLQKSKRKIEILKAEPLAGIPWLVHGFSTRPGGVSEAYGRGSLNLGITPEDTRENVDRNREMFLREARAADATGKPWPLVLMRQVHSSIIHKIDGLPKEPLHGDGLITNRPAIALTVRVADCLPVLVVDPVQRAVGVFHAGWRGTLARIVEKGVGEMRRQYASDPADLVAAIGPGIHRCCYEVAEDFREKFAAQFAYSGSLFEDVFDSEPVRRKYPLLFMNQRAPGHGAPPSTVHLDLVEANRRQLLDAGVPPQSIWASELCTSCRNDLLFSHRKEKGVTGRLMAVAGIRE